MAQPLVAAARIRCQYTVGGLTHRFELYCRDIAGSVGSYTIKDRNSIAQNFTAAADALAVAVDNILDDTLTTLQFFLDSRSGGIWTNLDTHTASVAGTSGGTYQAGWQNTLVFRDTSLKLVKMVVIESAEAGFKHWTSPTGGGSSQNALVKEFTENFTALSVAPWTWVVGRSNNYLKSSPFVGGTQAGNRKIRRARGLT